MHAVPFKASPLVVCPLFSLSAARPARTRGRSAPAPVSPIPPWPHHKHAALPAAVLNVPGANGAPSVAPCAAARRTK